MPLRDHFHPPLTDQTTWEPLHGGWPMVIVQQLNSMLPRNFVAAPRVHLGSLAEIDVATFEHDWLAPDFAGNAGGGTATTAVAWIAPPVLRVETELPDYDEYEVHIYDLERNRQLVAAIEIVSPANKDRPNSRNAFISKCAALVRSGVAVSIVDVVTERHFNLYTELMQLLGHPDPTMSAAPPDIYAASCRWLRRDPKALLESWSHTLRIGESLPQKLPLWLNEALAIPLDLERSYEQACRDLRIG
jgi:hypothetical protein